MDGESSLVRALERTLPPESRWERRRRLLGAAYRKPKSKLWVSAIIIIIIIITIATSLLGCWRWYPGGSAMIQTPPVEPHVPPPAASTPGSSSVDKACSRPVPERIDPARLRILAPPAHRLPTTLGGVRLNIGGPEALASCAEKLDTVAGTQAREHARAAETLLRALRWAECECRWQGGVFGTGSTNNSVPADDDGRAGAAGTSPGGESLGPEETRHPRSLELRRAIAFRSAVPSEITAALEAVVPLASNLDRYLVAAAAAAHTDRRRTRAREKKKSTAQPREEEEEEEKPGRDGASISGRIKGYLAYLGQLRGPDAGRMMDVRGRRTRESVAALLADNVGSWTAWLLELERLAAGEARARRELERAVRDGRRQRQEESCRGEAWLARAALGIVYDVEEGY